MVVIRVDMWPNGDETKSYSLGSMTIVLKGLDANGLRKYEWAISKFGSKAIWKRGFIEGHNPKTRGPWDLLFRILGMAVGSRNM